MHYILYLLFSFLTILVSCKPVTDEKLPHSRDYYAGYIKAITDNFDQLFATERKPRSADDEKENNSVLDALKKPPPDAAAAETEADIKHYDGSASRLLTEKKRDLSNEESTLDSPTESNDYSNEIEKRNSLAKTDTEIPKHQEVNTKSNVEAVKDKSTGVHEIGKGLADKKAKIGEVNNEEKKSAKSYSTVTKSSKTIAKKKKIQKKFEDEKDENNDRRHFVLEHADARALPFYQSAIKGYQESYPGQNYDSVQQLELGGHGIGVGNMMGPGMFGPSVDGVNNGGYNNCGFNGCGFNNGGFMNGGFNQNGNPMGNLAEDIPQGLVSQDLVPTMAGVLPSLGRRPRVFGSAAPVQVSPVATVDNGPVPVQTQFTNQPQVLPNETPFNQPPPQVNIGRLRQRISHNNEFESQKPFPLTIRKTKQLLMNPSMGQQNHFYMGRRRNHMHAMFLPMRQQNNMAEADEDKIEEQQENVQGQQRSEITQRNKKHKHKKHKSRKRCIYNKRKPLVIERIMMPTCDRLGCKLVPIQERCQNIYPIQPNSLQTQLGLPQQIPSPQIQNIQPQPVQPQILPVVINPQPQPTTLSPFNVRLGNTGCNPINNQCLLQNQIPTKIIMVPFYAGHSCDDDHSNDINPLLG